MKKDYNQKPNALINIGRHYVDPYFWFIIQHYKKEKNMG